MFYDVYEKLCRQNGESPRSVCLKLGFSQASAPYWKKSGKYPRLDGLEKIADYFGVSVGYLLEKDEPAEPSNIGAVFTEGIRMIPVYESVSAGFGAYADNHVTDTIPLLIRSEYEAAETICIRVSGDSMMPLICDGDIIQVHKQDSVDSGDIAVVLLDGEEGLVKKVVYDTEYIDLISMNSAYRTRRFEGEEVMRLKVVGKVKRVIHDL